MKCPNCGSQFQIIFCNNNLAIDHCNSCGGTFFKENEINRLTLSDAKRLYHKKETESISGEEKLCPKDKIPMSQIRGESVPQHVTLLQCDRCRGVFAYPDDLVAFKLAQTAKINYYKIWQIPLPSLKAVLVYSFVSAIALTVVYQFSHINRPLERVRAGQDICQLEFIKSDNSTVLYCKTQYAFRSEAHFKNLETREEVVRPINQNPETAHILSVSKDDIAPGNNICVKIILRSDKDTIETDCVPFAP